MRSSHRQVGPVDQRTSRAEVFEDGLHIVAPARRVHLGLEKREDHVMFGRGTKLFHNSTRRCYRSGVPQRAWCKSKDKWGSGSIAPGRSAPGAHAWISAAQKLSDPALEVRDPTVATRADR